MVSAVAGVAGVLVLTAATGYFVAQEFAFTVADRAVLEAEAAEEFACVADEYGGLAGIVTFEDIAEELTGPIADENDPLPPGPARQRDGAWELDAASRIDEAREATGLALPALLVRTAGVRPRPEGSDRPGPEHLARLITRSRRLGLLGAAQHDLLTRALAMHHATISGLVTPAARVAAVPAGATASQVRRAAAASGHTRLLVQGPDGTITGLVHARDAVTGTAAATVYPVPAPDRKPSEPTFSQFSSVAGHADASAPPAKIFTILRERAKFSG